MTPLPPEVRKVLQKRLQNRIGGWRKLQALKRLAKKGPANVPAETAKRGLQ